MMDRGETDVQVPIDLAAPKQTFTGADIQAYINNKRVGNLESVTWSISVEVVGNYVMGRRDAVTYTTGKRVIAGSVVFSQYDKHAFLHEVWGLDKPYKGGRVRTIGDLWSYDLTTTQANASAATYTTPVALAAITKGARLGYGPDTVDTPSAGGAAFGFGLSQEAFNNELKEQLMRTARIVGSQKFMYSDQVPPFDMTLIGVNTQGAASRCALLGMRITQETAGISTNDMGNAVGMSFVALSIDPWSKIENIDGVAYIPPTQ
jgi:hypothetical protein